jgi:hypothetical protein
MEFYQIVNILLLDLQTLFECGLLSWACLFFFCGFYSSDIVWVCLKGSCIEISALWGKKSAETDQTKVVRGRAFGRWFRSDSHQGGAPMTEYWWLSKKRDTRRYIYMHTPCRPWHALNSLGALLAKRVSPDVAPHPWMGTVSWIKPFIFITLPSLRILL